ncbi:MAG: hypothetical protein IT502_09695 [Rubrivivax sp.]|nr:hypothetical protein [Rubrivivax sp.]
MDRLLVVRLETLGVAAEARLNGVPVARVAPAAAAAPRLPAVRTVPVHEYTLAGDNELELVVEPPAPGGEEQPPQPRLGDGAGAASARLLLPRLGQRAHPEFARTLAQLEWAAPRAEIYQAPTRLRQSVALPINFPRWRWLDVPAVADATALLPAAAQYLQTIALGLAHGDPEPFVQATRLRFEELAAAYQQPLADEVGRFRAAVQRWHARQPLVPTLPGAQTLRLRPLAGGRLLECLAADGSPALASMLAEGGRIAWPMRLAAIEGRLYVLR